MYGLNVPSPDDINYHEARQQQRVQAALQLIDPGDVLAVIDSRIAAEPDPTEHPLYDMVCWHLERCLTPLDGGQFFDRFRQLVLAAIGTCLDDVLAKEDWAMVTTTLTPDTTAMAVASPVPPVSPEILEQVLIGGDLSGLTEGQHLAYYRAVCQSLGLNPLSKPFEYLWLNGKLRLYALRDCTDQLRRLHGISIYITNREKLGDIYIVTARAKDRTGREDESLGAVAPGTLKGDALANALMKCETKAKRRVTLSLARLGWLDESELATIPGVRVGEAPDPEAGELQCTGMPTPPEDKATRLTTDQARRLQSLAQQAYGYKEGERRLRADLGFEPDEKLTLRHLAAHVTVEQYQALMDTYETALRQQVEQALGDDDVSDHAPSMATDA